MFEFHGDMQRYHDITREVTENYVIPFIQKSTDFSGKLHVLEIGSGEAGVLNAFTKLGHQCVGIELSPERVQRAENLMKTEIESGQIRFIAKNIYDINPNDFNPKFNIIILKDVIEHIHEQEKIMIRLKEFLATDGLIFFGFPPWYMPFGGHQQVAKSKLGSKLPYYHLLPMPLFKFALKLFGEKPAMIEGLVEIKETGISIERFERIAKNAGFKIDQKLFYLFNPIYQYKFGVKPRQQSALINHIPFLRNFVTTCVYYNLKIK
ncbi:MAG: methyltransferase domain-containing protein [Flavobacteriales bacterium]|nr:methyltransferase domain-containing protein [Flavobacteriales bacterium]